MRQVPKLQSGRETLPCDTQLVRLVPQCAVYSLEHRVRGPDAACMQAPGFRLGLVLSKLQVGTRGTIPSNTSSNLGS
jgi:hypothetical protein